MNDARSELRERLIVVRRAIEAAEARLRNSCNGDYVVATAVGSAIEAARDGIERALDALIDADASIEG